MPACGVMQSLFSLSDIDATIAESRRLREQARRARSGLGPVVDRLMAERVAVQRDRGLAIEARRETRPPNDADASNDSAVPGRHATPD